VNFDLPYIINRSSALNMTNYPMFSRIDNELSTIKSSTFSSKALGIKQIKDINIEGRI
jgi:DNA polymerase delta subunit 1